MNRNVPQDPHQPIEALEIARQAAVEIQIFLGIESSLRTALQWMTRARANQHKLSTLRFHTWSFERHLTRIELLADHGGYLRVITDASPRLAANVRGLRDELAALHVRLEKIIVRLDLVSCDQPDAFDAICGALSSLLDDLHEHGQREAELLQQSLAQDVGGSG